MKKHIRIAIGLLTILYTSCTQTFTVSQVRLSSEFTQVLVDRGYIKDANNIQLSELEKITELDISDANLTSLDGIEHFKSLEILYCQHNFLTTLNVSQNTNLTELYCFRNKLASLDVCKNTNLTTLYCANNDITAMDISKNAKLIFFDCSTNQLTSVTS